MELPVEVDLRGLSCERRRALAISAMQTLAPGADLVFVLDCAPKDLFGELGDQVHGEFDVSALEVLGDTHTVEVRRHRPERSLIELIVFEHTRIDRLLAEVEWRVNQRLWGEAEQRFKQLRSALQFHMATEDQLLFPAYEGARGSVDTILTLKREHDILRALLAQVGFGLRRENEDSRSAVRALSDLRELFGPHARREETELTPVLEGEVAERVRHQLDDLRAV